MRALRFWLFVGMVVASGLAGGARAAEPAVEFGSYRALVIGNNDYKRIPKLKTAEADAKAVAALLRERYGFSRSN